MRPECKEGNFLINLEEVHGLECMIILTNKPDMLEVLGSFDPDISDHDLVYGVLSHFVSWHKKRKQSHSEASKMLSDFDERTRLWPVLPGML